MTLLALPEHIRAAGFEWPKLDVVKERQVLVGEAVDLEATLKRLEDSHAYYDREIAQMYSFARQWGASVDDITDNREVFGEKRLACAEGIAHVKAVMAKLRT